MIKWGFIGCGDVVEHKSGKPFWKQNESTVNAVMCRNINSAKDFANRYGIKNYYDDADELLKNADIDAVYIATPPSTHMMYAKKAIMAKKSVYVEKPMGLNQKECQEVLDLAKENNVLVFVAYYRRGLPMFNHIKKIIENNEIGKVRTVSVTHYSKAPRTKDIQWRRVPSIAGGGLFHDLGCHTLDILDYIISPIKEVYGFSSNQRQMFESDDTVSASFEFENGATGTGIWCFDVSESYEKVKIIGNEGIIEFSVFGNSFEVIKNGKSDYFEEQNPQFVQEPLISNVIGALQGKEQPLSTGKTAIRTTKVIDKIVSKK